MKLYLGAHLNFYHPRKENWLVVELEGPTRLVDILERAGIPVGEVQLVVVGGETVELTEAVISPGDEVRLFPAVGGG